MLNKKRNGSVHYVDLAWHMEVSKPSVSGAVAILQQGGFLTMGDYSLHLTGIGQKVAEKIYKQH